jgi:hypothetical protein
MIKDSRPPTLNPLRQFNLTSTEASFALPFATSYSTEHDSHTWYYLVPSLLALSSAVANTIFTHSNRQFVLFVASSSCDVPTSNELVESSLQGGHFTQSSSSSSAPSAFLALVDMASTKQDQGSRPSIPEEKELENTEQQTKNMPLRSHDCMTVARSPF